MEPKNATIPPTNQTVSDIKGLPPVSMYMKSGNMNNPEPEITSLHDQAFWIAAHLWALFILRL